MEANTQLRGSWKLFISSASFHYIYTPFVGFLCCECLKKKSPTKQISHGDNEDKTWPELILLKTLWTIQCWRRGYDDVCWKTSPTSLPEGKWNFLDVYWYHCMFYTQCSCSSFLKILIHSVPYIMSPKTAALSHRNPASSGRSHESCRSQRHDKEPAVSVVDLKTPVPSD
jgi:hypothetical protein